MARQDGTTGGRTLGSIREAVRDARERADAAAARAQDAEQRGDTEAAADAWTEAEAANDEETRLREEYAAGSGRELDGEGNPGDLNVELQREAGHARLEGFTTFAGMTNLEMLEVLGVDPSELDGLTADDVEAVADQVLEREEQLREEGVREAGRRYVEQVLDVDVSQLTDDEVAELVTANQGAFDAAKVRVYDNLTEEGLEALRDDPAIPKSVRDALADRVQGLLDEDHTTVVPDPLSGRVVDGQPERPMGNDLVDQLKGFVKEQIAEVESRRENDGMNPHGTLPPGEPPATHRSPDPMQDWRDARLGKPEAGGATSGSGGEGGPGRPGLGGAGATGGTTGDGSGANAGGGSSGGGSIGDVGQPPGMDGGAATGSSDGGSGLDDLLSGIGDAIGAIIGTPPPPSTFSGPLREHIDGFGNRWHDLGDGVWREGKLEKSHIASHRENPAPAVSKKKQEELDAFTTVSGGREEGGRQGGGDGQGNQEEGSQEEGSQDGATDAQPEPEPDPDLEYTPSGEERYTGPGSGALRDGIEQHREVFETGRAGSTVNPVREGGYEAPPDGAVPAPGHSLIGPGGDERLDGAAGTADGPGRSGTDWGSSTGAGVIDYGPDALVDYGEGPEFDMPTEFGPDNGPITVPGVDPPSDVAASGESHPPDGNTGGPTTDTTAPDAGGMRAPGPLPTGVDPADLRIGDPIDLGRAAPPSSPQPSFGSGARGEQYTTAPLDPGFGSGESTESTDDVGGSEDSTAAASGVTTVDFSGDHTAIDIGHGGADETAAEPDPFEPAPTYALGDPVSSSGPSGTTDGTTDGTTGGTTDWTAGQTAGGTPLDRAVEGFGDSGRIGRLAPAPADDTDPIDLEA